MTEKNGPRQQRARETRLRLIDVAEQLFVEHGYTPVSVERIVRAAEVTKGAFYHHFPDKLAVFRAAFERVDREMAERVMLGALQGNSPLEMVGKGMRACFELCTSPRYGRLVYIEAPNALGWEEWHRIDTSIAAELVHAGLEAAVEMGELSAEAHSIEALTTLLLGSILQAAITIAQADDRQATCLKLADEMDQLLRALSSASTSTTV